MLARREDQTASVEQCHKRLEDGGIERERVELQHPCQGTSTKVLVLGERHVDDATVLDAQTTLRMATLNGAAALGLDDRIGSLVVGKQADLCAVRLDDTSLQPCYDPAAHLIHAAGREYVSHVWVAGKPRVHEGNLLGIDTAELLDMANLWQNRLLDGF